MLLRFTVSNYLSFNKPTEFNMFTGDFRRFDNHVFKFKDINILKLSALYGANASGKSNLIKSIFYLKDSILKGKVDNFEDENFKKNKDKPSSFEIEFLENNKIYIFGIEVLKEVVLKEYLYYSINGKEQKIIFDRTVSKKGVNKITFDKNLIKTNKNKILVDHYKKKLKSNELFLSIMLGVDELGKLYSESYNAIKWMANMQTIFPGSVPSHFLPSLIEVPSFMDFTKKMLCSFDTGIKDIHIKTFELRDYYGEDDIKTINEIIDDLQKTPDKPVIRDIDLIAVLEDGKAIIKKLYIEHIGFNENNLFSFSEESDGTQRLIEFMSMLYGLIRSNDSSNVFLIDEIGRSIHPTLLKSFLSKLSKEEEINGQLIFTTHVSNLLDLNMFRPDEIWFAEKNNKNGSTEFKTLAEFKKIRPDLDIRKGYLNRRFGGIPMLANFEDLKWTDYATNNKIK